MGELELALRCIASECLDGTTPTAEGNRVREAADELERLTKRGDILNAELSGFMKAATKREAAQSAEIERLERELADAVALAESLQNKWATRPLSHPDGEALCVENDRLRAAISGWRDHYGWKDGKYVDNVNEVFEPLLRGVAQPDETKARLPQHGDVCIYCGGTWRLCNGGASIMHHCMLKASVKTGAEHG